MPEDPWWHGKATVDDADAIASAPNRHGVVCFDATDGGVLLLSATSRLRDFMQGRLAGDDERRNLRPVTRRVRWATVGSAFEADWLTHRLAKQAELQLANEIEGGWTGWYLGLAEPKQRASRVARQEGIRLVAIGWRDLRNGSGDGGPVIGVFASKSAADKYRRAVEAAWGIQAPMADHEPETRRGRLALALRECVDPMVVAQRAQKVADEMTEAAETQDFERAGALKACSDALDELASTPVAQAIDVFRCTVLAPAGRAGWVTAFACGAGAIDGCGSRAVAEMDEAEVTDWIGSAEVQAACEPSEGWWGVGLVGEHVLRPRSPVRVVSRGADDAGGVLRAARMVAKLDDSDSEMTDAAEAAGDQL